MRLNIKHYQFLSETYIEKKDSKGKSLYINPPLGFSIRFNGKESYTGMFIFLSIYRLNFRLCLYNFEKIQIM